MGKPKTYHPDPAETIRQLRSRVAELIEDAARWTAKAERASFERDEARRLASEYHGLWERVAVPGASIPPLPWEVDRLEGSHNDH